MTSITGAPYEILVVMNQKPWQGESGAALKSLLNADVPGLPQPEPTLDVSHCIFDDFTSMLKPARNILMVDIDSQRYTHASVVFSRDKWAQPQYIIQISAPDESSIVDLVKQRGQEIVDYFVKGEMDRHAAGLESQKNKNLMDMLYKQFGYKLLVPATMSHYKQGKDFIWLSTGSQEIRKDLVIFTVPYTSQKQFSADALNQTRDAFTKKYIPGPVDNSYMGTEYKFDHPIYSINTFNGSYCAELRGLWKVYGNTLMGGPFVSHSIVDTVNQRIVTVEGFVFAPGKNKRQPIRELEAVIGTLKLPTAPAKKK